LSESVPEETEVEETEEEVEETDEPEGEQKPAEDGEKALRALKRERARAKKLQAELVELRKQSSKSGDMGEAESLKEQIEELRKTAAVNDAVAELFDNGFNGSKDQAKKMIKLVDDFSDSEWVEELQTDFPERFGEQKKPAGPRPSTGHGRDDGRGASKDPTDAHSLRLLRGRR
jgi:hypothetical protein